MIVAGGSYLEICPSMKWRRLFGSGGRAAAAVASISPATELYTYSATRWCRDVARSMQAFGVTAHVTEIAEEISFSYSHPLAEAILQPVQVTRQTPIQVSGDVVLRFGFIEGDAIVTARRAIYDPQSGSTVSSFQANGSSAHELAVVLNEWEAIQATGLDVAAAGVRLDEISSTRCMVTVSRA